MSSTRVAPTTPPIVVIPHEGGTLACDGQALTYRRKGGMIARPTVTRVDIGDVTDCEWVKPPKGALTGRLLIGSHAGVWDMTVPAGMADDVTGIVEHIEQVAVERERAERRARIVAEARELNRGPDLYPYLMPDGSTVYRWWDGNAWTDYTER